MNPGKTLGCHSANPQVQWHQRRVLAAGALAVVGAGHQDSAFFRLGPGRERLIHRRQAEVAQVRDIAAVRQQLGVAGHDMVGGDIILHLQQHLAGYRVFQVVSQWERFDVRPADNFHLVLFAFGYGRNH